MGISDEKIKSNISRQTLVRIEPQMDVTDHMTLVSGTTYTAIVPYTPIAVYEDGTSKSFSYTASTETMQVTLSAAPSDTNPVLVSFYVFLTNSITRYLDRDDPTGTISNVAEWIPRINKNIVYQEYVKDIFSGQYPFSSASNIVLINNDRYFDQFFKRPVDEISQYNFYNRPIELWFGLNDEYQKIGSFIVESFSFGEQTLTFNLKSETKKLNSTASFNDSLEELNYTIDQYPNLKPDQNFMPRPMIFSINAGVNIAATPEFISYYARMGDTDTYNKAATTDYDLERGTGVNTTFLLGRVPMLSFTTPRNISFSLGTTADNVTLTGSTGSTTYRKCQFTVSTNKYFVTEQMSLKVRWGAGAYVSTTLEFIDYANGFFYLEEVSPGANVTSVIREYPFQLWKHDTTDNTDVMASIPYTNVNSWSELTTTGGNKSISVELIDYAVDPEDNVYYQIFHDTLYFGPQYVVYDMLDRVSIDHNYTSTSPKSNMAFFQVPRLGETQYKTYAEYLGEILMPVYFGILKKAPSTGYTYINGYSSTIDSSSYPGSFFEIDSSDIFRGTLVTKKRYSDVATKVTFENPDITSDKLKGDATVTYDNYREKQIYGIDREKVIQHIGQNNVSPYVFASINQMLKAPMVTYSLSVSLKYFDIEIANTIKILSSDLPNSIDDGSEFIYLQVVDIEKGSSSIRIEGIQIPMI